MKALATAALLGLAFTYEDNEYFKTDKLHQPVHRPIYPIRPKNHTNHTIRPIRPIHPIRHPIKPIHPRNHTTRPFTRPIYTAIPDVHVPTRRPPHVPRGILVKNHTKKAVQNDDEFFAFDEDEFLALAEDEFFSFEDDELFSFFKKKNATQLQGRKNRTEKPKPVPFFKKLLQNDDDEFFAFDEDEFLALAEDEFFTFDDDELFSFVKKKNGTQPHKERKNMTQLHDRYKKPTNCFWPAHPFPRSKKYIQKDDDEFFAFDEDEFFAFDEDEFFAFDDDELFSFFKKKNGTQPHKGRKNATHPHHGRKNVTQLHYGRKNRTERAKPIHTPKPKKVVENDDDEFFAFDDDELFSFFNRRNATRNYGRKNNTERPRFRPLRKMIQNDDDEFFIYSHKKNHTRKDRDPRFHVPLHKIPHFNLTALKNRSRIPARPRNVVENDDDEFFAFEDDLELFEMDHFGDNELKSKFLKGVGNFLKKHGPTLVNIGTKFIGLDDDELFAQDLTDHELNIIKTIGDIIKKKVGFDDYADDSLVHLSSFINDGLRVAKNVQTNSYYGVPKQGLGKGK